ncbi:MAG: hypothetical protein MZW92_37770 [Comamonadaceae bacterium]|nr:hypothetical protein [Comamonadaceae bacterium]
MTIFLHRSPGAPRARSASDRQPLLPLLAVADHRHGRPRNGSSIHRKHHAKCETAGRSAQPADAAASRRVLWDGAELYVAEADNKETLATLRPRHARRLARAQSLQPLHLARLRHHGRSSTSILFGLAGLGDLGACRWRGFRSAAAGVINGIGHYWGYRNFDCAGCQHQHRPVGHPDRRRGTAQQPPRVRRPRPSCRTSGTSSTSAGSTSSVMQALGLAKVKKVAPTPQSGRRRARWSISIPCRRSSPIATTSCRST